jgi:hypothetical protein
LTRDPAAGVRQQEIVVAAKEVRLYKDVVVHQNDVLSARGRYSRVARGGYARFLFVNQPQWRGKTLSTDDLVGVVGGAVVNHYRFPRLGKLLI